MRYVLKRENYKSERQDYLAAIDLGSNTCRLLVARPQGTGYKVVDSFSRVIRLGLGIKNSGVLLDESMQRAIDALKQCATKLQKYDIASFRAVATEACRQAKNKDIFLSRVRKETGIKLEIIPEYEEARLALKGCTGLVDKRYEFVLGFDIGGCSTEVMWARNIGELTGNQVIDWISIPYGVLSLLDASGGYPSAFYDEIRARVKKELSLIHAHQDILKAIEEGKVQTIGSSGTTTTIAAIYLNLAYYDRTAVDGAILPVESLHAIADRMRFLPARDRAIHPCIGPGRSEVVIGGLAILQGICDTWPISAITVADRGVRDGILADMLMSVPIESVA